MADRELSDDERERLRAEALEGTFDADGDLTWFVSPTFLRPRKAKRAQEREHDHPEVDSE